MNAMPPPDGAASNASYEVTMKLARAGYLSGARSAAGSGHMGRNDGFDPDHGRTGRSHPGLSRPVRRRGLAVRSPASADPLDALPLRRRAAMVRLRRQRQWRVLRPAGCKALWCWPAIRLPTLLPPRICGAARRADGPSSSSLATSASQAGRGLRWCQTECHPKAEVDAVADVFASRSADRGWRRTPGSRLHGRGAADTCPDREIGAARKDHDDEHHAVPR